MWSDCITSELGRVESVMDKVTDSDNPELKEMVRYVLANHGKRIRSSICILSYYMCGGTDPTRAINVGSALELIHNASLIHDDINDRGEMRRGAKALYREYSLGKSIVAGDYMFALGFRLLGSNSNELVDYVVEAAASMGSGEFSQKDYERKFSVGEKEYMDIISGKTARLIECAAKCGAFLVAEDLDSVEHAGTFAFKIGQAFQIIDDILDVTGDTRSTGKRVGTDIVEGKPTLPTIYGMEDSTYGSRIREIFENDHISNDEIIEALELIQKTNSIQRCFDKARSIVDEAVVELNHFKDSIYKNAMRALANFIVLRDR